MHNHDNKLIINQYKLKQEGNVPFNDALIYMITCIITLRQWLLKHSLCMSSLVAKSTQGCKNHTNTC